MAIATLVEALNVLESTMRTSPPFVRFVGGHFHRTKKRNRSTTFPMLRRLLSDPLLAFRNGGLEK